MTYEEINQYWIKIPEQTSSSPSGRHVGLYKAMHVCIPTEDTGKLQKELATMFLQIINICILSGYILTRWTLAMNIMLPKKIGVHDINKYGILAYWKLISTLFSNSTSANMSCTASRITRQEAYWQIIKMVFTLIEARTKWC